MRVVVVTPYLPHRRVGHGGGMAVRDLVTQLAHRHTVRLVSLLRPGEEDLVGDVAGLGVEVVTVPFLDRRATGRGLPLLATRRLQGWWRAWRKGSPIYVEKYGAAGMVRRIVAAVAAFAPDAVQIEYLQLAPALRELRRWRDRERIARVTSAVPRPLLVLNTHELGSIPRRRRARREPRALRRRLLRDDAERWERLQRRVTRWADVTLCVTEGDRRRLAELGGENVLTVPLGMDVERIAFRFERGDRPRYVFFGSFAHRPNRVAAEALAKRHWPTVAAALPSADLRLVGRGSRAFLATLPAGVRASGARIGAVGYVADLGALLRDCTALAAPLSEGGGIKIKILEAMARGLPVVTTPVGAEGIVAPADDAAWIVPDDETFGEAMLATWRQPETARRRAERARRLVEEKFSWSAIAKKLTRVYEEGVAVEGAPADSEGAERC